jgi:tRNA nucleotidyltransferase (CCA-adding enzyme)
MILIQKQSIPPEVIFVSETLEQNGFSAYLVGGCVRDVLVGREPKDWDITTDATPEKIISLFEKTVYENTFGTVGVCIIKEGTDPEEKVYEIVEVTPFRKEGKYSDNRHPDEVVFSENIADDLSRRDFTVNAMAYRLKTDELVDLYEGQKDLEKKVIRAVGDPNARFEEDALRMLRAIRFSAQLGFAIDSDTLVAIANKNELLKNISSERIRDEFSKTLMSSEPMAGVGMLQKLGLLKHFIPELEQGIGCEQGGAHKYDVFEHLLQALQHAADKNWSLEICLSALFHDIGKPKTRRPGQKKAYTFYGHEVVGARMAQKILERLKYPKDTVELVTKLVRYHMFFSDTEQISLSAVRRIVQNVGVDNVWTLMNVRECDRVGMAKVEAPYRLRKYHAMLEQVMRDPISVKQLAVDGNILMNELAVPAGRRMGWILNSLLEEVLDDPEKNTREYLDKRVGELNQLSDEDLKKLGEQAKEKKEELEEAEVEELHKKHGVKK